MNTFNSNQARCKQAPEDVLEARESPMVTSVRQMEKIVCVLNEKVLDLSQRLNSVMSPDPDAKVSLPPQCQPDRESSAPLRDCIITQTQRLNDIAEDLGKILTRLEI
jgi:hypothetical protein